MEQLPFANIIILKDNLAEVIINEGVEMNSDIVEQYHNFLLRHLSSPFALLINKKNAYTYDFNAQLKIASLKEIYAMAVITYNEVSKQTTHYLAKTVPHDIPWNLEIFSNREEALLWLEKEQMKVL